VLASEEEEHLSPFGKQVLEDVKQEAEMMHKLLDDLLFLARHDQGNFKLELEEFDLSSQAHSLLNRFKRIVPSQLTLQENIQDGIRIKGDKVRIQQLLYILLDNAARYTKEGSITCSLAEQGEKILLSVKDTGIGISPKDLQHIFERFYRGDESRKRNGTGLGLSIAKTIVEAHGGEIEVKSEVGKGTEFIIKLKKY
jgi:signal transduction histidine kinase